MDELELAEAVAEGAEFMDAIDVNLTDDAERWFWVVDPDTLDMSQSTGGHQRKCGCIFGQHHPEGYYFPIDYGLDEEGFRLGFDGDWDDYPILTALWREEIIDRRAAWFDAHPEAVIRP